MKFCITFIIVAFFAIVISSRPIEDQKIETEINKINDDIKNLKEKVQGFGNTKEISQEISTIRIGMFIVVGSIFLVTMLAINITFKLMCQSEESGEIEEPKNKIVNNNDYGEKKRISKTSDAGSNIYDELETKAEENVYDVIPAQENEYDEIPAFKNGHMPQFSNQTYGKNSS
ncbi:hypothetical protein PVAND_016127 [Polypedilum vanderplanki]|uniref:Uncharacterized protein n=1 Tax=Polypedilum vanderplanki TaxID=319348 RepID=A0A9J6BE74_POLVA|nr:hypothetical protein PVAND_016127 [Polypedilum vanderplanki]